MEKLKKKFLQVVKTNTDLSNENTVLKERIKDLIAIQETLIKENESALRSMKKLFEEKMKKSNESSKKDLDIYKLKIDNLYQQYANEKNTFINNYNQYKAEVETKMKTLSNNYIETENKMRSELKKVKTALQEKEILTQKLQKELIQLRNNNRSSGDIDYYKKQLNDFTERLKKMESNNTTLCAENQNTIRSLSNENEQLKEKIKQNSDLKTQINLDLQKEINLLHNEVHKYKELYTLNKNSNELLNKQIETLKQKYNINEEKIRTIDTIEEKYRNDLNDKEKYYCYINKTNEHKYILQIAELKKENDQLKTKYIQAQIDKENLQKQNKNLELSLNDINNHNDILQSTISDLNRQLSDIKGKNENFEKNISETKILYTKEISQLKAQIESLSKKIAEKESVSKNKEKEQIKKQYEDEKTLLQSKHREEINHLTFSNLLQLNEIRLKYEQTISDLKIENSHLNHQLSNSKLPVIGKESKLLLNQKMKVKLDKDSILNQMETSDAPKQNYKLINKTNLSPCKEYKSERGKGTRRKRNPFSISEGMFGNFTSESSTIVPLDYKKTTRFSFAVEHSKDKKN